MFPIASPSSSPGPRGHRDQANALGLRLLTPQWEDRYDEFVSSHPHGLFYSSRRYRDFLVGLLGCQPHYGIAHRGAEIVGVMPLMGADGPFGQVLNSLPYYGSNGGILAIGDDAGLALADWYATMAGQTAVAAATVIDNPLTAGALGPMPHDLSDERIGHFTALLPSGPFGDAGDPVAQVIDGSARRNVQKALRAGVTVAVENEALAVLERLHRAGMAAVGGQAKTSRFFEAVPEYFRPDLDYRVYVARLNGVVVAALLLFYFGTTVEYYVPCTALEARPIQPMAAVLHRAMTDAIGQGFHRWNWGGSWVSHVNLMRFKAKWGGKPIPYRYWTTLNQSELLRADPDVILAAYPGFYVLPFSPLQTQKPGQPS